MQKLIQLKILENKLESGNYYSILLKKPAGFTFLPGECFDLRIITGDFNEGRIFSFSSSPTEEILMTTYKKGITEYKKRLEEIAPGDSLFFKSFGRQYTFDFNQKLFFFAGGIGIAVFRSAIKFAIDNGYNPDITLIYNNRDQNFPFKAELDSWKEFINLKIYYRETQKSGRQTTKTIKKILEHNTESMCYIAGPPDMVDETSMLLKETGVPPQQIITDSFDGYLADN